MRNRRMILIESNSERAQLVARFEVTFAELINHPNPTTLTLEGEALGRAVREGTPMALVPETYVAQFEAQPGYQLFQDWIRNQGGEFSTLEDLGRWFVTKTEAGRGIVAEAAKEKTRKDLEDANNYLDPGLAPSSRWSND